MKFEFRVLFFLFFFLGFDSQILKSYINCIGKSATGIKAEDKILKVLAGTFFHNVIFFGLRSQLFRGWLMLARFVVWKSEFTKRITTFSANSTGIAPAAKPNTVHAAICFGESVLNNVIVFFVDDLPLNVLSNDLLTLRYNQEEGYCHIDFGEVESHRSVDFSHKDWTCAIIDGAFDWKNIIFDCFFDIESHAVDMFFLILVVSSIHWPFIDDVCGVAESEVDDVVYVVER